ncbi:inactive selenide, water dikinase-like protein [Drosophila obscura]|uniref:inactive selenide, water dikinase-like protein n=1 Tax=Drosophila obscura TaxID=7282 RepID=UPI001BB12C60|nr:inactive selenide, water dikinase-like protein [Drosophila obscura]
MSDATDVQSAVILELQGVREAALPPSFNPSDHGLEDTFRLTRFVDSEAGGCKVPKDELLSALLAAGLTKAGQPETVVQDETLPLPSVVPKLGIPFDCSVIPLRTGACWLVQAAGFCCPIIDDPYAMGKIACAKVLNNLYAMGVSQCDSMTLLLGVSSGWTEQQRDVVLPIMMRGFKSRASEAGAQISGVQIVVNSWCMLGGVASTICQMNGFIEPGYAIAGDVLLLTKPLGTQLALDAYRSIGNAPGSCRKPIKLTITEEQVKEAHRQATKSMSRLNREAARLMFKHNAHGATHVGELGLLGHAQHLAYLQKNELSFSIYNLPLIGHMAALAMNNGEANDRLLLQGLAPEHSGGLLICMPREQATSFCSEIKKLEGHQAWIIGKVEKGNRSARVIEKVQLIHVEDE